MFGEDQCEIRHGQNNCILLEVCGGGLDNRGEYSDHNVARVKPS